MVHARVPGWPLSRPSRDCESRIRSGSPILTLRRSAGGTPRSARRSTSGQRRDEARADNTAFLTDVLVGAGFDPELIVHADDAAHDDHIRADTELALSRTGPDVGTPILTFRPGTDREGSFFGPVISKAPRGADAVELWDAVEKLATSGVAELKRSLREPPDYT